VAAACWLALTVAQLVLSGQWWFWLIFGVVPPATFIAVPVVLTAGAAFCRRSRRPVAIASLGALLVTLPISGINFRILQHGDGAAPAGAIRVFSWNTEYWDQGGQTDAFYRLLRAQDADVYLLQEYLYDETVPVRVDATARLRAEFPGYRIATAGELITLSRFPILRQYPLVAPGMPPPATPDFPEFWLYKVLRTDLDLGGGRVLSTYNVHLPVQLASLNPLRKGFYAGVRQQDAQREPQWRALARDVDANRNPTLVAGDFNTTPAMGDLRKIPGRLRDASYAMTTAYPLSWFDRPGLPLWWRLDWVFVSERVRVHSYGFGSSHGLSDHRYQRFVVSVADR
jgi:endonuclease/exonuclease/phosphatase (EEP) superfamily protein YafD